MLIFALPPVPHYGGYPLSQAKYFRRAKSEWSLAIPSGPTGALGLQNSGSMRFHDCAWLCRANGTGAEYAVGATLAVARKPSPSKGEGAPEGGG